MRSDSLRRMGREREEVGKQAIHLDGGAQLVVGEIVREVVELFMQGFSLRSFARTLENIECRQTKVRDKGSVCKMVNGSFVAECCC